MKTILVSFLVLFFYSSVFSQDTSINDIAFCAYHKIKKQELNKEELVKYLKSYYLSDISIQESNEFDYQMYLQLKFKFYQNMIDTLNLNNTFVYNTTIVLDKYNFEKQGFPFEPKSHFPFNGLNFFDFVCYQENWKEYNFMNVEPEKGALIIKQLSANYQNSSSSSSFIQRNGPDLEREIKATYKFKFTGKVEQKEYEQFTYQHFEGYVLCNIIELNLYDNGIKPIIIKPNKIEPVN